MARRLSTGLLTICIVCTYLVLGAGFAAADNRTQNIDMFLVVDKSLSMATKIDAVKQYIDQSIIKKMLIPGDYLIVIDFWGKARVLLSTTVGVNKAPIEKVINSIQANGHWTDIGNALDELKRVLKEGNYPDHRKYFMLLTDGIQEAPPTSKYYSPTGKFNNALLDNAKTIQKKGWKIEILGIGTETAAAELAKNLSAGFASVPSHPTPQQLAQKTENFLGMIEATHLAVSPIGNGGKGVVTLKLVSTGYSNAQAVSIAHVRMEVAGRPAEDIAGPTRVTIAPNGTKSLKLPVTVHGLPAGTHAAKITFAFEGQSSFNPAVFRTSITVRGFIQNHLAIVAGGGGLIVVLALLAIFLIARSAKSRKVAFQLTVEGDLRQSNRFVLRTGGHLFIQDNPMGFRAVEKEIPQPVARVSFDGTALRLEILNSSRLSGKDIPMNVLGERVRLKTNAGKDLYLKFEPA